MRPGGIHAVGALINHARGPTTHPNTRSMTQGLSSLHILFLTPKSLDRWTAWHGKARPSALSTSILPSPPFYAEFRISRPDLASSYHLEATTGSYQSINDEISLFLLPSSHLVRQNRYLNQRTDTHTPSRIFGRQRGN